MQGRFVYYGADPSLYSQQRQRRSLMSPTTREPSELEAVAILVEKIKHPALSVEALCRLLLRRKLPVEPEMIRSFFARHGLGEKKDATFGMIHSLVACRRRLLSGVSLTHLFSVPPVITFRPSQLNCPDWDGSLVDGGEQEEMTRCDSASELQTQYDEEYS